MMTLQLGGRRWLGLAAVGLLSVRDRAFCKVMTIRMPVAPFGDGTRIKIDGDVDTEVLSEVNRA